MTPKQIANEMLREFEHEVEQVPHEVEAVLVALIRKAAAAGVASERERCAKIAENEGCGEWSCGVDISQKIRSGDLV
jgi:hypothetical protein